MLNWGGYQGWEADRLICLVHCLPDERTQIKRQFYRAGAGGGRPRHTNRLIKEKSPYLLQHAHNPVDWYPWGEEAFERAKELNRPILLSSGYSTCHWWVDGVFWLIERLIDWLIETAGM